MPSLFLRNVSIPGSAQPGMCDVLIRDGIVKKIGQDLQVPAGTEIVEAEGLLLLPGLIDCHVHFREPGLEHKATMKTEYEAALAGGVTTVCEMPNTIPPTVTIAALADKVRRAEALQADIRFFFGITQESHLFTLKELWTGESDELKRLKARCSGVKLYLDHSTGNQKVDGGIIESVFDTCAKLKIPIIAHCEDPAINEKAAASVKDTDVSAHSPMRPPEAEAASITFAIGLSRKTGAALHVAHLSTKQGIDLVRAAKKDGLPVTCEVSPHHLFMTTADYETLGTKAKMNPPLRSDGHVQALWEGMLDGTVDCVATDHAPHTLEEKNTQPPLSAPSGVPGVETMLPLLLTAADGHWPHPRGKTVAAETSLSYERILQLCFVNPNHIFSLDRHPVEAGAPANCILVDPLAEWVIRGAELHGKCGWTPYEGWRVTGRVVKLISMMK